MESIPDILGQSQTFLGVLLTLNVLCLYGDKTGNFIFRTILAQKDRLKNRIDNLKRHLDQEAAELVRSDKWEKVEKIAAKDSGFSPQLQIMARTIMMNCNMQLSGFVVDLASFERNIKTTESANEQFLGPLLSLYYGLLIFIFNEVVVSWGGINWIFTTFTYVFTLVSFAYTLSLWWSFTFRHSDVEETLEGSKFRLCQKKLWDWTDRYLQKWGGALLKLIISGGAFALVAFPIDFSNMLEWLSFAILSIAFTAVISSIGFSRLYVCEMKGNLSYLHGLGHMTVFIIYAALITALIVWSPSNDVFKDQPSVDSVRLMVIAFALFNGIFFPFILPYFKFKCAANMKKKEIEAALQNVRTTANNFNIQYDEICKSVGDAVVAERTKH